MSSSFEDGGEDEQIRSKIDEQVRWYMRERYACRLKLCAVAQLVGSGAYGFGPRLLPSYAFGLLCAAGGALAFGAAHTCCLLYTSPSPRDQRGSRMPSSA